MKLISNGLDITIDVIASQLSDYFNVIGNRLWHQLQNKNRAGETRGWCVKIVILSLLMYLLCQVRNKIMYVLLWQTVSAFTRVLFWCWFPLLLRSSGNKHQNNPLMSAETVGHSNTYIILYLLQLLTGDTGNTLSPVSMVSWNSELCFTFVITALCTISCLQLIHSW